MDPMQSIDDIIPYIEDLKISAFRKAQLIKSNVHNVTIGPNSTPPKRTVKEQIITSTPIRKKEAIKGDIAASVSAQDILPIQQVVKEFEIERRRLVQKAVESHSKKFEIFAAQQAVIRKQQWLLQQQKFVTDMQHQEKQIMLALKEYEKNKSTEHEKLILYYQNLEEERKKSAAALEAKKRERELLKECLNNQSEFQSVYHDILKSMQSSRDLKLQTELATTWEQCKSLNDLMTELISQCKTTQITAEEKNTSEVILKKAKELKFYLCQIIKEAKEHQLKSESQSIQKQEPPKPLSSQSDSSSVSQNTVIEMKTNIPKDIQSESSGDSLDRYVSKANFRWYSEIIEFFEKYSQSFKELLNDDRYKQFRFECKKAVNLTVNAISAVNSQHILDKYMKLSHLLKGQNVVIGDFQINASLHPQGIQFCTDLLAKKFVYQGDSMISSSPEAAFSFATIINTLWNEHSDFGKLLLAYFFKECPYLVPLYIPRVVDQSDEDYYKSQGYKYSDGQIEKQDKFLKRMTGIMRLYFSVLISFPKRGQNTHPHNIKVAWTWLVSVLKLEPRIDITATMLHVFFETVGYEIQNTYKMQFFKLLRYFVEQYFQSMKKIDIGGPVTRLECLIQEFKENRNQFKAPSGLLSSHFW